jgi:hypothetical protein
MQGRVRRKINSHTGEFKRWKQNILNRHHPDPAMPIGMHTVTIAAKKQDIPRKSAANA